jgi:FixJ family two-component response regulator
MEKRRTIAVVDDEDSVRKALERLLRAGGLHVVTFPGGTELLHALPALSPQCIVLDLHMPKLSGFEVLEILMQSANRPPVVVVTGHDSPEARARALACGASAYLSKPIDDDLLLNKIASAIAASGEH